MQTRHEPPSPAADRIVRPAPAAAMLGVSEPTLWRRVKDGTLPAPVRVSTNAVGWRLSELQAHIAALPRAR